MLSDPARLRVLRALEAHELAVGEVAKALQLPQSTVSRHIKPLFDAKIVARRVEGTTSLYKLDSAAISSEVATLWSMTRSRLEGSAQAADDDARLATVLAARRVGTNGFFGRIGGEWDAIRRSLFGDTAAAEGVLGLLDPNWVVADIGSGTGEVSHLIAPFVARVVAIDREPAMVEAGKRRLAGVKNVEFRRGDVLGLPARRGEFDAAVAMLVFHHLEDPAAAAVEIARVLKVGGRLLVVDMVEHDRSEYRTTMSHMHLGFSQRDARQWARASGMRLDRWHRIAPQVDVRGPGLFSALLTRL